MDKKECEFCDRNEFQVFKADIIHKKTGELLDKRKICEKCLTKRKPRVTEIIIDKAHQKYQLLETMISASDHAEYMKGNSTIKTLEGLMKLCFDDFEIKRDTDS